MLTQRKIYHLLKSFGQGDDFWYLWELRTAFDLSKPILVTDKLDGSTMQTDGTEPWKRFDRFKKGDKRKFNASEEERYELRICQPDDPLVKWYIEAFNVYRDRFAEFGRRYPGFCAYFEALGGNIGGRFPGLKPTIRVFDVADENSYLPFLETVKIAESVGLPVVPHRWEMFGNLETLLEILSRDVSGDKDLPMHILEGWVLRQMVNGEEVVAKIRIADLAQLSGEPKTFVKNRKITAAELVHKLKVEECWICTGGEETGSIPHDEPNIVDVSYLDDLNLVRFVFKGREPIVVLGHGIVLVEPWMIQVYQNYQRRQQASRKEGGQWRDVVIPVAAVRLRNPEIQRAVVAERHAARKAWLDE